MFTDKLSKMVAHYENLLTWYVGYDYWNWTPMWLISWTRCTVRKDPVKCHCKGYQQP